MTETAGTRRQAVADINQPIRMGVALRHARLAKGLRIKDVADRSGYSESMISKIETNKATPSLNMLYTIAKVLGTSVSALTESQPGGRDVVLTRAQRPRISETSSIKEASDGIVAEVMIPFGASTLLQGYLLVIAPGGGSGGSRNHDGEEVGYLVSGQLILTVSDRTYHLNVGDTFFFPSNQPHTFFNPGKINTEIVWINSPPTL